MRERVDRVGSVQEHHVLQVEHHAVEHRRGAPRIPRDRGRAIAGAREVEVEVERDAHHDPGQEHHREHLDQREPGAPLHGNTRSEGGEARPGAWGARLRAACAGACSDAPASAATRSKSTR